MYNTLCDKSTVTWRIIKSLGIIVLLFLQKHFILVSMLRLEWINLNLPLMYAVITHILKIDPSLNTESCHVILMIRGHTHEHKYLHAMNNSFFFNVKVVSKIWLQILHWKKF